MAPPTALGSLTQGLFNLASGIGNPLASYLNFTIRAQITKEHASVIDEWPFPKCEVGTNCPYWHGGNFYVSTASLPPISEKLGISISYKPRIADNDPTLVTLQDLTISYATATGDMSAPVDTLTPYQYTNLTLHTDQVYTIAGETSSRDFRTGHLLSGKKIQGHTRFILILSVKIIKAGESNPQSGFEFTDVQKVTYSDEERPTTSPPLREACGKNSPLEKPFSPVNGKERKRTRSTDGRPRSRRLITLSGTKS